MAHELDFSTGRAAIALSGGAASAWHKLGETIEPGDDVDTIVRKAGLDWQVLKGPAAYRRDDGGFHLVPGTMFTYRSDTGAALGAVSENRFSVDNRQPRDIVAFFRDFLRDNGLSIETAGALRGGRSVWCLAKLGADYSYLAPGGDRTDAYVRLSGGYDGGSADTLDATTVRVVCANTERMANAETAGRQYKVSHSSVFDARALQAAFGLLGERWRITCDVWNALQQRRVTDEEAREFFCRVSGVDPADVGKVGKDGRPVLATRTVNGLQALADAYRRGPGAQLPGARQTAYGLLNAVTYYADHQATVRDTYGDGAQLARLASVTEGTGAQLKDRARKFAAELAGVALAA